MLRAALGVRAQRDTGRQGPHRLRPALPNRPQRPRRVPRLALITLLAANQSRRSLVGSTNHAIDLG